MTKKSFFQGELMGYISRSIKADNWKAVKDIVKWAGKRLFLMGGGSGSSGGGSGGGSGGVLVSILKIALHHTKYTYQ